MSLILSALWPCILKVCFFLLSLVYSSLLHPMQVLYIQHHNHFLLKCESSESKNVLRKILTVSVPKPRVMGFSLRFSVQMMAAAQIIWSDWSCERHDGSTPCLWDPNQRRLRGSLVQTVHTEKVALCTYSFFISFQYTSHFSYSAIQLLQ